jgi:hypothetical protein
MGFCLFALQVYELFLIQLSVSSPFGLQIDQSTDDISTSILFHCHHHISCLIQPMILLTLSLSSAQSFTLLLLLWQGSPGQMNH